MRNFGRGLRVILSKIQTGGNCHWVPRVINARNKRNIKLTMDLARQLRADRASGMTYSKICEKYNVSKTTAISVVNLETWRDE